MRLILSWLRCLRRLTLSIVSLSIPRQTSRHSYREKLCLLQISVPAVAGIGDAGPDVETASEHDVIVDPLADLDLQPLRQALEHREIVLHGGDYDLRMLQRGLNLTAQRVFDTMIAARLLGVREFSLAALVKRYFGVELPKGSQKANWQNGSAGANGGVRN